MNFCILIIQAPYGKNNDYHLLENVHANIKSININKKTVKCDIFYLLWTKLFFVSAYDEAIEYQKTYNGTLKYIEFMLIME